MWIVACLIASASPVDPDEAVRQALSNAHTLTVERAQLDRRRHSAGRVDLHDITLGLEHRGLNDIVAPQPNDDVGPLNNTLAQLSWRPPRLAELGLSQSIGTARADIAALDLETQMRDIAAETRLLHAHVLLLRDERALMTEALVLAGKIKDAVAAKLQAEQATQVELSLASLDVLDLKLDLDEVNARLTRAEARLARVLGSDELVQLAGAVPECRAPASAEAVLAVARERSPRLRALALERGALDSERTKTTLRLVPWVDRLRVGYLNHRPIDGRNEVHLGVDVDVPLFALLDGAGDEVDLRQVRLEAEVLEAEEDVESEVASVVLRQESAAALFDEHEKATVIITAESTTAVDAALASGRADAVGASTVHVRALKAQRASLHARERCVEAVIDVWRTTGAVLPRESAR